MGTTLTGTTPQDTYDSLIKVTDNGPLSGSLKTLTDGLGNDSALALSTGAASVTGTLAVSGTSTFNGGQNVLYASFDNDAALFQRVGAYGAVIRLGRSGVTNSTTIDYPTDGAFAVSTAGSERMRISAAGNVGIGTSSPASLLTVQPANDGANTLRIYRGKDGGFEAQSAIIDAQSGNVNFKLLAADAVRYFSFQLSSNSGSSYTQAARIDLDGLKFGSDTAAANALDDYEEGTWTPNIIFGGGSTGVTYGGSNAGTYTKIGRKVSVNAYLDISNKGTSTGAAQISNLPFTIAGGASNYGSPSFRPVGISFADMFVGYGDVNDTKISLQECTNAGSVTVLTDSDFSTSTNIIFSFTYFTA